MNTFKQIKLVCGVLLLAAFFMPLSRCYYIKPPPGSIEVLETTNQVSESVQSYHDVYAYRTFRAEKVRSWGILLAFTWPLLLMVLSLVAPKIGTALLPVEPFACVGSGIVLATLLDADRILWGGYLAILALLGYFLTATAHFYRHTREQYLARTGVLP